MCVEVGLSGKELNAFSTSLRYGPFPANRARNKNEVCSLDEMYSQVYRDYARALGKRG